jgi:transposase
MLGKGKHTASVRNRAQVLLMSHLGLTDKAIATATGLDARSVRRIRKRYVTVGFERCLTGVARSGRPRKFDMRDEAELTALACSEPPEGRSRWTLGLLQSQMKKPVGLTSVYLLLKKTAASRGDGKCGVLAK